MEKAGLILDSFSRIEAIKAGEKLDLVELATRLSNIKKIKADLDPRIARILEVADKTELISGASATYASRSRGLLEKYHVDKMLQQIKEVEKRINLKVRNELKEISAKVDDYSPICMESLDADDLKDVEKLVNRKDQFSEKIDDFEKEFPNIEQWLKNFHKECKEWIRNMESELSALVKKVKGPVAKATRILHKRRNVKSIENDIFDRLRDGTLKPEHCEECEKFQELTYKKQMHLVRRLIKEEDERMEKIFDEADGLTEEEMGIVEEMVAPEKESSFKWKGHDEAKEKKAAELKEELERIQRGS